MNKRHYEHTLPNIRGSLSNTYYYSQYKRVTGTFYVKRNNDENVTVKLNLRLHDGVRFKAEVTADLMKPSGGGTPE